MTSTATVFHGGRIVTMDPRHPDPEVVVIAGERVVAVGDRHLADAYPHAQHRDLAGRTLLPGFIDAHCHLSIAALQPLWVDASTLADLDALSHALDHHAHEPASGWLRIDNWNEATGLILDRQNLDEVTGDRPAIVMHTTYHQAVLNSAALDLLGIGPAAARADPLIATDDRGEPTGLVLERSAGRAHSASLRDYADPDRWADHIERHATTLLGYGITAVHDAACDPAAEAVYALLATQSRLPLSVLAMPAGDPFLTNDLAGRLDGPPTGTGDHILRVGPVKLFADGGAMPAFDVHVDGHHLAMGYRHPDLHTSVVLAVERGFRVAVHAMGNQGIADTLDAFETAARSQPDDDHRFRVEHFGLANAALARRAAGLGAVAVVQPGFVHHVGRDTRGFEPDDATWLPFATLADAGVILAGSSDDPCGPIPPLHSAHLGAHRHSEGLPFATSEAVPIERWLEAYTIGAAHAGSQEAERGSISPDKVADLAVIDADDVAETWTRGRLAHTATNTPQQQPHGRA